MKVHCDTCGTDFKLDESRLPPEGAWVRCGICGEVFQVTPLPAPEEKPPAEAPPALEPEPAAEPAEPAEAMEPGETPSAQEAPEEPKPAEAAPEAEEAAPGEEEAGPPPETPEALAALDKAEEREGLGPALQDEDALEEATGKAWIPPQPDPEHGPPRLGALDLSKVKGAESERAQERASFGLEERPEPKKRPARGSWFKILFWFIGLILLAIITALGSVVVMARLGVGHEVVDRAARLPGMAALMGRDQAGPPVASQARLPRMSLVEVKNFLKDNETAGKIFVIQGKVINNSAKPQRSVLVQGLLRDATGKVVKRASSYAGSVFTPAELKFMSLGVIERRLSSDLALDGRPYVVRPGEALPFMIVLANLPKEGLEFTAEVINSEPLADKPVLR